jgi:uncharacterized protein with ParB-like and HNH nuclease domain
MAVDAFGIEKEFLRHLLDEVADGRAQLPEFQRGWVWPDRNIAALLASISLGYPVGTIMMLRRAETFGSSSDSSRGPPRCIPLLRTA